MMGWDGMDGWQRGGWKWPLQNGELFYSNERPIRPNWRRKEKKGSRRQPKKKKKASPKIKNKRASVRP